jgi:hypothetical protein
MTGVRPSSTVRRVVSCAAVVVSLFASRPAGAETKGSLFHARASAGPSALLGRGTGAVHSKTESGEARGWYTTSYGGGGLAVEGALGLLWRGTTFELLLGLDWYRGEHFATDATDLDRMDMELTPALRSVVLGLGFARALSQGSAWRMGGQAGIGAFLSEIERADGTRHYESFSACLTAAFFVGPRWTLVVTGSQPENAFTFGLRARLGGGVGLESVFANGAILADLEFD